MSRFTVSSAKPWLTCATSSCILSAYVEDACSGAAPSACADTKRDGATNGIIATMAVSPDAVGMRTQPP